jgi:hypothetical protein
VARKVLQAAEALARAKARPFVELETRIELMSCSASDLAVKGA